MQKLKDYKIVLFGFFGILLFIVTSIYVFGTIETINDELDGTSLDSTKFKNLTTNFGSGNSPSYDMADGQFNMSRGDSSSGAVFLVLQNLTNLTATTFPVTYTINFTFREITQSGVDQANRVVFFLSNESYYFGQTNTITDPTNTTGDMSGYNSTQILRLYSDDNNDPYSGTALYENISIQITEDTNNLTANIFVNDVRNVSTDLRAYIPSETRIVGLWGVTSSAGNSFTISIDNINYTVDINQAPTFDPVSDFSLNEDFTPNIELNLSDNFTDIETPDSLVNYTVVLGTAGIVNIDESDMNGTGNLTFYPVANQSGSTTINITGYSETAEQNSTQFTFTINAVNDAPNLKSAIINTTSEGNTTNDNLTLFLGEAFDVEGDPIQNITDWMQNNISDAVLNMPMESTANTTGMRDYSSYNNEGNIIGATCNKTNGLIGGGCSFDGVDDGIILFPSDSLNITSNLSWSVSFWAKPNENATSWLTMVDKGRHGTDGQPEQHSGWSFLTPENINGCGLLWELYRYDTWTTLTYYTNTCGEWTYYIGTYDGSIARLYVNGILDETSVAFTDYIEWGNSSLGIGVDGYTGTESFFNGSIDQLMIWNRTLSANEISNLYNNNTHILHSDATTRGDFWRANVTVNDGTADGNSALTEEVEILNAKPTFSPITDFAINEDDQLAELNISLNISDIDDPLTDLNYTITENNSLFSTLAIENGTGNFTYQPSANSTGTTTINITVIDNNGTGLIESDTFDITINAVNDNPTTVTELGNSTQNEDFGTLNNLIPVTDFNANWSDVEDASPTTYTIIAQTNASTSCYLDGSNNLDCESNTNLSGTDLYTFELNDSGNLGARYDWQIVVNSVNDNPFFNSIDGFSLNEDFGITELNISLNVSDVETAQPNLNYSITNSDTSIITVSIENGTGNFTMESIANVSGTSMINITVVDEGDLIESTNFTITVNAVNDPPSIPILHLPLNGTTLSTNLTFEWNNVSDVEGDQINYTIEISNNITFPYTNYSNSTVFETANVTIDVIEALNDSEYYWRVIAFDGTDNSSDFSEVRTVTVDNIPPLILIINPLNQTYFNSLLDLEISSSGDENTIWYNLDNGVNITITSNTTFTSSLGDHILNLYANDSLGNENRTSVSYNIGNTEGGGGGDGGGGDGGGGDGGSSIPSLPLLSLLGEICSSDSQCKDGICDLSKTKTCVSTTKGNKVCEDGTFGTINRGEDKTNTPEDCSPIAKTVQQSKLNPLIVYSGIGILIYGGFIFFLGTESGKKVKGSFKKNFRRKKT
mgnify:CR=1 FL=1